MTANRRDIIKASASIGLLAVSEASAQVSTPALQAPADRRLSAPRKSIGFLHSTGFDPKLDQAFLEGLRSTNAWEGDPAHPISGDTQRVKIRKRIHFGNYGGSDTNDLNTLGQELQRRGTDVIVAVGGLVSAQAVQSYRKSILVVVGRDEAAISKPNMAGWNLDSFAANRIRVAKLTSAAYSISSSNICLLYNSNSVMGVGEKDDWTNNIGLPASANANNNDHNDDIDITTAFSTAIARLADGPKAIVVSADPFLGKLRQDIIDEAKKRNAADANLKLVMCYPSDYLVPAIDITNGTSIVYGPVFADIYRDLGNKSARILSGATIAGIVPITEATSPVKNIYSGK